MTNIILITGASGSGKTTIAKYLAEKYKVFYFDDIGVPSSKEMVRKYGSPEGWQKWATKTWMEKLSKVKGPEVVILEGSFNPEFAVHSFPNPQNNNKLNQDVANAPHNDGFCKLLCLHANRETREKRLIKYRNQRELANQDMENFAQVLKEKTQALCGTVIDSSGDIHDTVKACLLAIEGTDSLRIEVPIEIARLLVKEQFPQYAQFEIKPVEFSGWDNATFYLGDEMLLRLPRGASYALKVPKEQVLLNKLRPRLSIHIPQPIALGMASGDYPFNWSIYKYLEGESANSLLLSNSDLENIAYDLALFLKELHKIDTKDAPLPGLHNYWRGEHVSVYECGARKYLKELDGIIDSKVTLALWEKAVATKWEKPPVWIHGDLAAGNFLISHLPSHDEFISASNEIPKPVRNDDRSAHLTAVIDFGGCAIGDPACDLVIAYTFFKGESREIFKQELSIDENTWLRAKAWVLWKAGYQLMHTLDKSSPEATEQIRIFNEVLSG